MLCRRCKREIEPAEDRTCPHCGESLPPSSGVMKTSTILITQRGKSSVYHSVSEVPAHLRRKLRKSTNGLNSATILIADRRGREEIEKAMRRLPKSVQRRLRDAEEAEENQTGPAQFFTAVQYRWISVCVAVLGLICCT
jgi:hypothetical protein